MTISIVVPSILLPSIIILDSFTSRAEEEIVKNLEDNAFHTMDKLSRIMFDRIAEIKFLTGQENNIMVNTNSNIQQKVEYLKEVVRTYKYADSMSVYDNDGVKIGDTRNFDIGVNERHMPFYENAIRDGLYYDKIPVYSGSLREYVIHFSRPITDENGSITGVLVSRFPLNKINDVLDEAEGTISKSVKVDLLSPEGYVIYSNHDRKSILNKTDDLAIFDRINNSDSSIVNTVDYESDNTKSIFVSAKESGFLDYEGNNWLLILSLSTDDLFGDVESLKNTLLLTAIMIISIATVLVFIFARTISKPIIKLKDAANQIAKGVYDIEINIMGKDEIGVLSTQFDKMRQNIISSNKKLNELIAEKTRRLQSATDELEDMKEYVKMVIEELHFHKGNANPAEGEEEGKK